MTLLKVDYSGEIKDLFSKKKKKKESSIEYFKESWGDSLELEINIIIIGTPEGLIPQGSKMIFLSITYVWRCRNNNNFLYFSLTIFAIKNMWAVYYSIVSRETFYRELYK